MTITKVHHHGFTVSDLGASLKFYRDTLGLKIIRESVRKDLPSYDHILGFKEVHLQMALLSHPVNEFFLELFQYINPPTQKRDLRNDFVGSSHVAFEVADVDLMHRNIVKAGYSAINDPVDVMRDGLKVARSVYALDPDGISVELFQEFGDIVSR